ncbi:hypothetical protein DUNSADRAFT_10991 [Dunaliella salina]|uniref:Encoded protein n=1 Tax=Dunaliella salina TaxID=3046 RepID=A0ABQ7GEB1_DUNSA|nr:hypothetical protein DUNSADRAFT_10991 [Dunaliella salina]|eukprot:KAF5832945.1 hypothetical protein DUNSADRAFT_10991 [Dunaliella salina]
MRYKADYHPSDLNCPESKAWVRITPEVLHALDARKYVVLSQLPGARCARNSAPVGVAAEREAPHCDQKQDGEGQGGSSASSGVTSQAHASTPARQQLQEKEGGGDEEALRRQHVLQEVARRKARQQAISAAADEVKTVVFDMVYPWKVLKHAGIVVSKEQAGAVQRLIEAWVSITGGVADKLGYELA